MMTRKFISLMSFGVLVGGALAQVCLAVDDKSRALKPTVSKYQSRSSTLSSKLISTESSKKEESIREELFTTGSLSIGSLRDYLFEDRASGTEDDSIEVELVEDSEEIEAVVLPLHHFDPDDDGTSIVNTAILSFLSMLVYSDHPNEWAFDDELESILIPLGAWDVEAFVDSQGTEGAIVTLPGATIIVYRGTSSEGTHLPIADHLADINDDPLAVEVDSDGMYVHEGFWVNVDNVYPLVAQAAADGYEADQAIWVTGHSLGAALGTHTALRLHYDEGITVQGLQTFGSPRVGGLAMMTKFLTPNVQDKTLWAATQRWVVDGDPATTFFYGDYLGVPFASDYIKYEHVGTTNTIYPKGPNEFEIKRDTGEDLGMKWTIDGLAADGSGEHLWYHKALLNELVIETTLQGELELAEEFWHAFKL